MSHNQNEKDYSEYDVNSDDPIPNDQPAEGEAAGNANPEGACNKCCCKACMRDHPVAVRRFQEMIFFYKPIALAVLLVLVNVCFFIYAKLSYSPLSLFFLCYAIYILLVTFYEKAAIILEPILFGTDVTQAEGYDAQAPNHIRTLDEIEQLCSSCSGHSVFASITKTYQSLKSNQTLVGRVIWVSIIFVAFILSLFVRLFWPCVIIVNLLLIVPGILLHPQVYPKWIGYVQKPKTE